MFRDKKSNDAVKPAWRVPWWRTCESCDREFWWERAWVGWWTVALSIGPYHNPSIGLPGPWHKGFVCVRCSADSKSAMRFFGVRKPEQPKLVRAGKGLPPEPPLNRIVKDFGV